MKYQLIGQGDAPLPAWAASVQAQLTALDAGPKERWKLFRRCNVVCRKCGGQLAQVMGTDPPVVVTRSHLSSYEHPHAVAMNAALPVPAEDDPEGQLDHYNRVVDTHILAGRRARLSSTRSWWQALDRLPEADPTGWESFELNCKCRSVPITRTEFLALVEGRRKAVL